jgi:hypothetical protein
MLGFSHELEPTVRDAPLDVAVLLDARELDHDRERPHQEGPALVVVGDGDAPSGKRFLIATERAVVVEEGAVRP